MTMKQPLRSGRDERAIRQLAEAVRLHVDEAIRLIEQSRYEQRRPFEGPLDRLRLTRQDIYGIAPPDYGQDGISPVRGHE